MGIIKNKLTRIQNKMSVIQAEIKDNTHKNNSRFNYKENRELQYKIEKRLYQSIKDKLTHYKKTYLEAENLERNRRSLGRKRRSNGKMNKKQRNLDKPEVEILDVDKIVAIPTKKKQQF